MDAVAPALLVAQGIGRIGNYFNKELSAARRRWPWGLEIRTSTGCPAGSREVLNFRTFQPVFLYELIFRLCLGRRAGLARHHRKIKPPGLSRCTCSAIRRTASSRNSSRIDSSVPSSACAEHLIASALA